MKILYMVLFFINCIIYYLNIILLLIKIVETDCYFYLITCYVG